MMRRATVVGGVLSAVVLAGAALFATPAAPISCTALQSLQLTDTKIESATEVAGPSFTPPDATGALDQPARLSAASSA